VSAAEYKMGRCHGGQDGRRADADCSAINPSPDWEVRRRRTSVFLYLVAPLLCAYSSSWSPCPGAGLWLTAVVTTFTPAWVFSKVFGLIFGFILFGDPLISHVIDELDRAIPDWKERIILEQ
jgi:hypothetical protein